MTAFFGKLQGETLELREGLNILQAPNETGKSTWCAFLISMLYGINSRERDKAGFIADKNRYAPWAGGAMSGRLDCRAGSDELTLTRSTRRPTAPMGDFQAVYTGTGDAVPGLTGQNCGETLLGVSREVFERSAFIRQAGLPISQDVGLERRVAALITSGEEDVSYSETAAALKKQLNRRRHNKTGLLPSLETELQNTERQIAEVETLERQFIRARTQMEELSARETELTAELADCDRWENSRRRNALVQAETAVRTAEERAAVLRRRIETDNLPETDVAGRLRGALVNLQMAKRTLDKNNRDRDIAKQVLDEARAAAEASPFSGKTPEEAERLPLDMEPKPRFPLWGMIGLPLIGILFAVLLYVILSNPLLSIGCGCGLFGLPALFAERLTRKKQARWEERAAELRRRRNRDLEEYEALYQNLEAARREFTAKSAVAEGSAASISENERNLLSEIRRFAPAVSDIASADQALRDCALRRKSLTEAESAAREARMRFDLLCQQSPPAGEETESLSGPPARPREEVLSCREQVRTELAAARSAADRLSGQLHAIGDPAVLRSFAGHLTDEIARLEQECAALRLAMEALDSANTALQHRFSPALGRRTSEIFRELTGGRYTGAALDRAFRLSAEPAGDSLYRDAAFLSAGAADQLYLSARLAICDLVLPRENAVPVILDDALASFDDDRCAAALRWLRAEAEHRQILLFTCHSREAGFFSEDRAVSVQRLQTVDEPRRQV